MAEPIEHRIIQQFACYYDVFVPEEKRSRPLIIAMHGYGGDKTSMMRLVRRMITQDCVIACLQGPHQHIVYPQDISQPLRYGFGWLTNFKSEESVAFHHQAVNTIIDTLSQEADVDAHNVFLMGFSQSCALNFRFAFTYPERLRGVIGLFGGIPGDWANESKYRRGDLDVLYIGGEQDEFYPGSRILENGRILEKRAKTVATRIFPCGHEIPKEAYSVIDQWITQHIKIPHK